MFFIVEPACSERDIVVTTFTRKCFVLWSLLAVSETQLSQLLFSVCECALHACVLALCIRPSRFVRAITYTFMHGFQNNLARVALLEE